MQAEIHFVHRNDTVNPFLLYQNGLGGNPIQYTSSVLSLTYLQCPH